jgi:cyanophycin synthetase
VSRKGKAVLNAEDARVAGMAAATDAEVIYFSRSAKHPVMAAHLADGGAGVFVQDENIVIATGQERYELAELSHVPFTLGGKIGFQVLNALAAVAATWGAGLNPAIIERGLASFEVNEETVPGRFNQLTVNGVEVVLDYGHNVAALQALGEAVQAIEPKRTIMAISLPGDRSNEDLAKSILATVPYVDSYVLYNATDRRGRAIDEVPQLMRQQIPEYVPSIIAANQKEAIHLGLQQARPGDRLILIADLVDMALAELQAYSQSVVGEIACGDPITVTPYWMHKGMVEEVK